MGASSLQADSLLQPRKKRSFSLPSFRRSSAGGQRHEFTSSAPEEAVRVQKAAAWQWYTRGVGEAVVPTRRPPLGHSPPSQAPTGVDDTSKGGRESKTNNSSVLQKTPLQAEPPRAAASRFKAEAGFNRPTSSGTPLAPSDAPPTPLYDELELSGLRTQMADFVQRLQTKDIAVADLQKSKPRPNFPTPTSVSTDHQAPPSVPAATASDHQLTKLPASSTPVVSTIPFHLRPFSSLHRLFRKVVSRSILKSTKKSLNSSPSVYEAEVLPGEGDDNTQYHYHHYVHHHHHHYHYDQNPEESAMAIPRGRRHSESSGIYPHIPSLWEAESDEEEEGVAEESPIHAYLARRRRHSDSFAGRLPSKKAVFDGDEGMKGESAKVALPLQFPGRYKSERFSPNKIAIVVSPDYARRPAAWGKDEFDEELAVMKNRRYSSENHQEKESLERKVEGGGKSGGGAYKLGGGATLGKPLVRRRHSESSQRPEAVQMGKHTPSPGRPYWQSPSARYYIDVLERHIDVPAPVNATPDGLPRNAVLPPVYPH